MMTYRSEEETKKHFTELMGIEQGNQFRMLVGQVSELFNKWKDYETLFVHHENAVMLLNQVAPDFFGRYQELLEREVALQISRLTDPKETFGRENLTIRLLSRMTVGAEASKSLDEAIDEIDQNIDFIREWRNRVLAHSDLALLMGHNCKPLPAFEIRRICHILLSIQRAINIVAADRMSAEYDFDNSYEDASHLLLALIKASPQAA